MTSLCISLEARSAVHRCFRAYQIAVGQDLFGAWLVEMGYGRIATTGRAKVRSFATTKEALAQVDVACGSARTRHTGSAAIRVRRVFRCPEWDHRSTISRRRLASYGMRKRSPSPRTLR